MKLAILVVLICCWYNSAWAQLTVRGQIVIPHSQPAIAISVSLLRVDDSAKLRSTISTNDGSYYFNNVGRGNYQVVASAIEFETTVSHIFSLHDSGIVVPDLQMVASASQLQTVTITGKKPLLEQHVDKLVLNVQNSPLAAGTTAAEVLRRLPGVRVMNDRVVMTGKNRLVITIDGRLSQYQDMNALLRAIPAANIDRVELMSNPSAKFDAEGDAVINIVLKRKILVGTNGTIGFASGVSAYRLQDVGLGTRFYQRYNPSIAINHQSGRISLFANYNFLYRTQFEVNNINRYKEDSFYDQHNYNPLNIGTHTYQAGVDYKIDSTNSIGLQVSGYQRNGYGHYANVSEQSNISNGHLIDHFDSKNQQRNHNNNLSVNLNWRHLFSRKGRSLAMDADAARFYLQNTNTIDVYPFRDRRIHNFQRVLNPVKFATLKIDYVQPISVAVRLEAGLKTSFATIDNNLSFMRNGFNDATHSNRFEYNENINAAYANYYTSYHKWDVQAGLRAEQTIANGTSKGNKVLHRNYVQAFPSILLTRRIDSVWAITGQYGRRIGRPGYQQQNPFEVYLDPLTYTRGNPLLRPQVTNSLKLSLTYTGLPVLVVSYDQTNDVIVEYAPQQKTVPDANGTPRLVSFSVAHNLASARNLSTQLNFPLKAGKVLDGYGGVIATLQSYSAFYSGAYFKASKWNYTIFAQADLKFGNNWLGQVSAYYATPSQYEFIRAGKNSSVDVGIARKMLKNKARLSLNISDAFFCDKTLGTIKYQDIDLRLKQYSDTRNIILSFTYNFGSQHLKAIESHASGAEEETKRVKTD